MAARTKDSFSETVGSLSGGDALVIRARRAESRPKRPCLADLGDRLQEAASILTSLDPALRPRKASGSAGGLLVLPSEQPVLVLPDLHARAGLLRRALEWTDPGNSESFLERLETGSALLLLLGDLFHSEDEEAAGRWSAAGREYADGFKVHKAMDREMDRALSALDILARAMIRFPGRILCLKGNHDNSRNREGQGDHSFYKFAQEGPMCAAWFAEFSPPEFRAALAAFEDALPLAAAGKRFAASHAEPAQPLDVRDLVEGGAETVEALTWTANGQALPGSVEQTLRALMESGATEEGALWISGHRPVEGRWALRAEGLLVQIHAPYAFQGARLSPDRPFDPETDIREL